MKLSSLEYNNKKCYKIETDSSNTKSEFTVIFDKETKLPVAIQNGKDSKVYNVKVEIGNVQDSKNKSFNPQVKQIIKSKNKSERDLFFLQKF